MSSQRGNVKKKKAQKHQNSTSFKNNLHDTSTKTKMINNIQVTQCCSRCTEIIEWKIKYKKYKPLTVPKKCTRCEGKTVKRAYCILCESCTTRNNVCMKCGESKDIVRGPCLTEAEEATRMAQLEQELKFLPERERRTFLRLQESGMFHEKFENDIEGDIKLNNGSESDDSDESESTVSESIDSTAPKSEDNNFSNETNHGAEGRRTLAKNFSSS